MEISKDYVKKFKKSKDTWYGILGQEMTEYFGRNCFWIAYQFEEWKIREKFKAIQDLNDSNKKRSLAYFIGMLRK